MGHDPVVERNLRYLGVREHIAEHIGLFHIVQYVHMLLYFQQIIIFVHRDRSVCKNIHLYIPAFPSEIWHDSSYITTILSVLLYTIVHFHVNLYFY